ncbi:uncharacterized protein LOC125775602 [Bactrocera dorsalis]|uniref:Uncharacterized protein LOC125775602 n=1 Tax=Bactrocera dorsalis TaxID=27457 RepID=A0ABM3IZ05_BACDO|nr:uncharacterized protein LOC125775602 [Bactrocera dorsalis]
MDTTMDNQDKRTKTERTTQEQLQHYIIFCKQHPELQRGKLTPTNPQGLQILWSELADNLNALRGNNWAILYLKVLPLFLNIAQAPASSPTPSRIACSSALTNSRIASSRRRPLL